MRGTEDGLGGVHVKLNMRRWKGNDMRIYQGADIAYGMLRVRIDQSKNNHSKMIFQTSHSLRRKWLPFFCPVKSAVECWLHSLYLLLAQEQGNSEQLVFSQLPLWQMARSAPAPKVGPKLTELKMALFQSMRLIFCLREREKRNDSALTSEWRVLAVDFQGMGVKPPMVLLNSVFTSTSVLVSPSHSLWNSFTEKLFSEARQSSLASMICLWSNSLLRNCCSSRFSTSFDPFNSSGFFKFTLRSFRSNFLGSFFTDFLSVFLGLSSSVLTLEALRTWSSNSGKLISCSQFLRKTLSQALLEKTLVTLRAISACSSCMYSMNLRKPQLLMLRWRKLKRSSVTEFTWRQDTLAKSLVYRLRMMLSLRSSVVISVRRILRMIWSMRCFSRSISSWMSASKVWKYFWTASLHSLMESMWNCSSCWKWWLSCSRLMVS